MPNRPFRFGKTPPLPPKPITERQVREIAPRPAPVPQEEREPIRTEAKPRVRSDDPDSHTSITPTLSMTPKLSINRWDVDPTTLDK